MDDPSTAAPRRWQPVSAIDRRVLGVLVEKAKTTPDAYPMTLNGLRTGCNQKSNRFPTMEVEADDVEESLERLRLLGAIGFVEGAGRVNKYRHYLYEWLGVDKVELAIMAELLLRGAQTVGELRGRAARMEPIADLAALKPVVDSLIAKQLVVSLTPEGRGQVVSHALYLPREMERVREEYARVRPAAESVSPAEPPAWRPATAASGPAPAPASDGWQRAVADLRDELTAVRAELDDLRTSFQETVEELHRLKSDLGAT